MTTLKESTMESTSEDVKLNGAQAIIACLEAAGIEYVFGMCGHTNVAVLDALADSSMKFISVRHEQLASYIADGYFRMTHRPAVVLTTIGPGLTNTLTGVGDAALDCSAMVIISGNVPVADIGRDAFQELTLHGDASQHEAFRPFVKRAWQVYAVENLPRTLFRALNFATSGRPGPVLVDVPMDLFSKRAEFRIDHADAYKPTGARVQADEKEIERAAKLLLKAERPLIVAGNGVLLSEASLVLRRLADYCAIPVVTTLIARGAFPESNPLSARYVGTVGTRPGNALAREADLIVGIGSRFSEMDTSSWNPAYCFAIPPARLIQVDIEPTEIGKAYPVDVGLVGDARAVLEQLFHVVTSQLRQRDLNSSPWVATLREHTRAWESDLASGRNSNDFPFNLDRLFSELRTQLPEGSVFVSGVGSRHAAAQQFVVDHPLTQVVASGYGSMGFGSAASLGVKLARPEVPVVAVVGDGDFTAISSPLSTAVENGINVVWVILNNYGYNSIELYQHKHFGGRRFGTQFIRQDGTDYNPDFAALARAYGAGGASIRSPEEFSPLLQEAISSDRPFVLDVPVTRTPKMRASGHWRVNDILAAAKAE